MSDNNIPGGKKFGLLETEIIKSFVAAKEEKSKPPVGPVVRFIDNEPTSLLTKEQVQAHDRAMSNASPLVKSVLNVLNGGSDESIERLAFEVDPGMTGQHSVLWRRKLRLLPNDVIKRILIQDDLVAAIVNTRSSHVSNFGRPQPDRHSLGFKIEAEAGLAEKMNDEQKKELQERIARAELLLLSCGQTKGWDDDDALSFSQYLFMSARNAVGMGMIATEVIFHNTNEGKKFHSFRPIDAGTIYRASPQKTQAQAVRREALNLLETVRNKRLVPERYMNDEYSWVQVISGRPVQAFTSQECLVHNFYPTTDVELDGYPVTPLDTVISAVTTHINATTHNRLWFQNGRAARNAIVVRSDDADERMINKMTQDFNAKINSVSNCVAGTSEIWTSDGFGSIASLLGEKSAKMTNIWTGTEWREAQLYKTGKRELKETLLSNGITVRTSPDHKFRIWSVDGLSWKEQRALAPGDFLVVNRKSIESNKFEQQHKQPIKNPNSLGDYGKNDHAPPEMIRFFAKQLKDAKKEELSFSDRGLINEMIREGGDICTRTRLVRYMDKYSFPVPAVLRDFNFERVVRNISTGTEVEMYDVSVYDDTHAFVCDGVVTHNSWRTPVIGIGSDDEITMLPMDGAGRDMEFQYLSDTNARVILAAFQISPEEVPGYGHLCLSPDTLVWTNKGLAAVGSLLGDKTEASGFSVWTGKKWTESRVFATGKKNVAKTHTSNGVSITTSPDHLFRAVDERGELCWRKQSELSVGDVILVNRMPAPGHESNVPSYRGKKLSCDMMEVLGWLTGDGSISVRKAGKTKHSKNLDFYYHHEKEKEIQQRHASILQEFGLSPTVKKVLRTEAQIERQKAAFGFKSVASERIFTTLHDTEFVGWLLDLGFAPSTSEKAIPDFIFALPVEHRAAFLKGFFSADGTIDSLNTPSISISAESTREKTKNLLLSMGIRTRACEGKTKNSFQKNGAWDYQKVTKNAASKLIIKDKHEFFERIGFLQDHKQPDLEALAKSDKRWDKIHKSVAVSLCDKMLAGDAVKGHEARDVVRHALKEMPSPFRVRSNVQRIAEQYGFSLPEWTEEFYQEFVSATEQSEEQIDMVDIEVFDDVHAFVANGIVVHNSRGTNSQALSESNQEYKLQAARDVGIRPLLGHFQAFVNERILPLIDLELSKIAHFKFVGLDADTAEKESVRLQQDLSVHMTMDEVLDQVEKHPIGERWGGRILLNPQWHQMVADKYLLVGDILEHFFGIKGASQDPRFQYVNNPLWFQWQQMQMQAQQMQMQAQQMQPQGQDPSHPSQQQGQGQPQDQQQDQQQQPPQELTRAIDQLTNSLSKAEYQLSPGHRKLLVQQRLIVQDALKTLESEAEEAVDEILSAAEDSLPDHLKE